VAVYRFGQFARRLRQRNRIVALPFLILHALVNYYIHIVYQVGIDDATIGPGLYIGHIGTIHIGPVLIGSNFNVTHNVTIGVGHSEGREGIPTIGDNVWVGTGAVIAGAIQIGNGVTISNGCQVSKSIPDGSLVAGNPGRVVNREFDNSNLLGFQL